MQVRIKSIFKVFIAMLFVSIGLLTFSIPTVGASTHEEDIESLVEELVKIGRDSSSVVASNIISVEHDEDNVYAIDVNDDSVKVGFKLEDNTVHFITLSRHQLSKSAKDTIGKGISPDFHDNDLNRYISKEQRNSMTMRYFSKIVFLIAAMSSITLAIYSAAAWTEWGLEVPLGVIGVGALISIILNIIPML